MTEANESPARRRLRWRRGSKPEKRLRTGIALLWIWGALAAAWLGLYLFADTTLHEWLMGEVTCLLGAASALASIRREKNELKN